MINSQTLNEKCKTLTLKFNGELNTLKWFMIIQLLQIASYTCTQQIFCVKLKPAVVGFLQKHALICWVDRQLLHVSGHWFDV